MSNMKFLCLPMICFCLLAFNAGAATPAQDLDTLLDLVKQGKLAEDRENQAREARFKAAKDDQSNLLAEARATREQQEKRSAELEKSFEENEQTLAELEAALNERLGSLKELFGVLQQVAGDTTSNFENSIISAQFKNRGDFLSGLAQKMGTSSQLASIEEMERLWFELQREMTESGKVARFATTVVDQSGVEQQADVIRVGAFNLVSDGKYLRYNHNTDKVAELVRQLSGRLTETTRDLASANPGELVPFGIDPSRGTLLEALIKEPNLRERVESGGIVGYIIILVGILALLLALERIITLSVTRSKVKSQMKSSEVKSNNPLGRVLGVHKDNRTMDPDTLELKLAEAIIRERPRLERFIPLLKIIAVATPLMGLLGTVIGMILTFQAITLFGTGDPKLMAGGISQALVTTVLGLLVAIPTVFMHSIASTMAKGVIHTLEEQSAGLIAQRMEQQEHGRTA
ncbi:MotA/TolQ/ExbB proton channel family protein [Marinobacter salarius]|uniref:MotA/TolQ/ExbB proton channel family protein n=1 Tax=Marinobacter salarius TaxID=1420917 RepID=UPI003D9C13D3